MFVRSTEERKNSWPCPICKKGFTLKTGLRTHLEVVHEGKKPWRCEICDHNFSKKQDYRRHADAVHEGKRPFVCYNCNSGKHRYTTAPLVDN